MSSQFVTWAVAALVTALAVQLGVAGETAGNAASDDACWTLAIPPEVAARVAQERLTHLGAPNKLNPVAAQVLEDRNTGRLLCYGFDLQPTGYIVVCASRALPPVIAYSLTDPLGSGLTRGHPLADLLQGDLGRRLAGVRPLPESLAAKQRRAWDEALRADRPQRIHRFEQWPPEGSTPTGGWLLENWTQTAPYNDLCPMDLQAGKRSLAGCPAVAMAQIMNYQGRLNGTTFDDADDYYHNYAGNLFWIDDDYKPRGFPSWPELNVHLATLFESYFNGAGPSDTSKAALVFACGAAARQVYSYANGSGTFGVSQALEAYEKFGCGTVALLDESTPDLEKRLEQNMKNAFPAHLAVVNESWTVGHNLVIDGYNTDGYFHLNFGWGGGANGWYQLLVGLPYELTVIEGVVVDIMIDECAAFDCNCDGLVDGFDFAHFGQCLLGPATPYEAPGCAGFDGDWDGDIDLHDCGVFQAVFGGTSGAAL